MLKLSDYHFKDIVKFSDYGFKLYTGGIEKAINQYIKRWRWIVLGNAEDKNCLKLIRIDALDSLCRFPRTQIFHIKFLEKVKDTK